MKKINKTKIYVIAFNGDIFDHLYQEYTLDTQIAWPYGAFYKQEDAALKCVGLNANRQGDDDIVEEVEDYYYVHSIELK